MIIIRNQLQMTRKEGEQLQEEHEHLQQRQTRLAAEMEGREASLKLRSVISSDIFDSPLISYIRLSLYILFSVNRIICSLTQMCVFIVR